MSDALKFYLWAGLAAVIVGAVCVLIVTIANSGSRNLAIATSTLLAAILLFGINARFELRENVSTDAFSTEYTVDRQEPKIRQWAYPVSLANRLAQELNASRWLAENDPASFEEDREKLTRDMTIFSLVQYLTHEQFDWQMKRRTFQGATAGTLQIVQRISTDEQCTAVSDAEISDLLAAAENSFSRSGIFIVGGRLCLPPKSSLRITDSSLAIATPFCTIEFRVEMSGSTAYVEPGTGGGTPQLPGGGGARYETRLAGIQSLVTYSWIRAQSREMAKYEAWSNRVIEGARHWFEGDAD